MNEKLAEAVLRRHRPGALHGNPQPRCYACVYVLWPCAEYELARRVLNPEVEQTVPEQGRML